MKKRKGYTKFMGVDYEGKGADLSFESIQAAIKKANEMYTFEQGLLLMGAANMAALEERFKLDLKKALVKETKLGKVLYGKK